MEEKQHELEPLLTAPEMARRLNVSKELAYQLMRENALPTVRFGRSVRVRPCDLEEYIIQHSTGKMNTQ